MENNQATIKTSTSKVSRFAHPFYTPGPVSSRPVVPGVGNRMTDYIKTQLQPIPMPQRDPTMMLAEIIGDLGVQGIIQAGQMCFHSAGDSPSASGDMQQTVADTMSKDYDPAKPETSPAFFFHLGDVNYYNNTDEGYHAQFYEPYKTYPGKIIAIPGNHDGELFKYNGVSTGQSVTLEEFQKNFCQPQTGVPSGAGGTIYREMTSQPGVYWYLNTPFIDIIGLYSNMAENPGYISGTDIGTAQKDWLTKTLTAIKSARAAGPRKALLIATHHPPLSSGQHSSSTEMLNDIDDSCTKAAIMPDAFLSAHAHNIQCYTRYLTFGGKDMAIPYWVCGGAGRQIQKVPAAEGTKVDGQTTMASQYSFDKSYFDYGYLTLTASATGLTMEAFTVSEDGDKQSVNKVAIALA